MFSRTEQFFPGTQAFASPTDIFSQTSEEAMSVGLAKACVPGKNCSFPEKTENSICGVELQQLVSVVQS